MMERAIDVFCHCLPPAFCDAANRLLKKPLLMFERAQRMPVMVDTDARLQMMGEFPGHSQILSLASPTVEAIADPDQAPELARIGNDALCEIPIRPMTVADYANEEVSKFDLWWAFGWPYESSLAMARLVFSGLFDRWPDLTVITHHCGGVTPMMEGRIESGLNLLGTRDPPQHADAVKTNLQERPIDAFRKFHADTASFGSKAAIRCALEFFGIERILFATDSPFDPQRGSGYIRSTLRAIDEMELGSLERQAILSGNAMRLLNLEASHD